MFNPAFPIATARGAAYNPRQIDAQSIELLQESIRTLGLIRPIIVTHSGLIIAGHQRTKSMRALGITACPAFVLPEIGLMDEVRFNQLHNASDKELSDGEIEVPAAAATGWHMIAPADIRILRHPKYASKLNEVLRLLTKHGEWGSAVVTRSGRVVVGQLYAKACRVLRIPLRTYAVEDSLATTVEKYFGRQYGKFSYEHLPKTTWAQSLAQMMRLRDETGAKGHSRLYETCILPKIKKGVRLLDFGAGQKDYVKMLQRSGYDVLGVEFYLRKERSMSLDLPAIQSDISAALDSVRRRGLFDVVVCDSVLNSTDSMQAERDVLNCVNSFCRPGGMIAFSGRQREFTDYTENELRTCTSTKKKTVYFIDDEGFSAMYQRGVWLYQKFHTRAQALELGRRTVGPDVRYGDNDSSWTISGRKAVQVSQEEAEGSLRREFNLPLPSGKTIGRGDDAVNAYREALAFQA